MTVEAPEPTIVVEPDHVIDAPSEACPGAGDLDGVAGEDVHSQKAGPPAPSIGETRAAVYTSDGQTMPFIELGAVAAQRMAPPPSEIQPGTPGYVVVNPGTGEEVPFTSAEQTAPVVMVSGDGSEQMDPALSHLIERAVKLYDDGYGNIKAAVELYDQIIAEYPDEPDGYHLRGLALNDQGMAKDGEDMIRHAIELRPNVPIYHANLGALLDAQTKFTQAAEEYWTGIGLAPFYPPLYNNLGNVLHCLGRVGDAIGAYRRAVAMDPNYDAAYANLLFVLDLIGVPADLALAERKQWAARYATVPPELIAPHTNTLDPDRPLRTGYVSADFRRHSAAAGFGAVVLTHDRDFYQPYCFANQKNTDDMTEVFKTQTHWRDIARLDDPTSAQMIRDDQIDILVDLSGHSGGNRLRLFGHRPAPIQMSAIGYVCGTGIPAMDYLLADAVVAPPEWDSQFSEQVIRMPVLMPFAMHTPFLPIEPLPMVKNGHITFGCFNRTSKWTDQTISLWADVLAAIPDSRMILKYGGSDDPEIRARIDEAMRSVNVDPARVESRGSTSWEDHQRAYGEVDVALDPTPHGGGITALEGITQGVPTLTVLTARPSGRTAGSFMLTLKLPRFVVDSRDEYVRRAVELAADAEGLTALRPTLRGRLITSIITDHQRFEQVYQSHLRDIWKQYVDQQTFSPAFTVPFPIDHADPSEA